MQKVSEMADWSTLGVLSISSPGADVSAFWAVRLGRLYETGLAPALDIVASIIENDHVFPTFEIYFSRAVLRRRTVRTCNCHPPVVRTVILRSCCLHLMHRQS